MDCRGSALLAVGLVSVVVGCTPQRTLPVNPTTPPPAIPAASAPSGDSSADSKLPKRTPKPATCVALGQMRERDMEEPDRTPAQREMLADHARKSYQQAIHLDAQHVPAYHSLARLHVRLAQHAQAVETYRKALSLKPADASLWFELGMCQSRQKQWDAALDALRKACELAPDNRPYAQTLAYALARAGRYDDSLVIFQRVVGPAQAHVNLARMLLHLEQTALARYHLSAALQLDPKLTAAQEMLVQLEAGTVPVAAPDSPVPDATSTRPIATLSIELDDSQE